MSESITEERKATNGQLMPKARRLLKYLAEQEPETYHYSWLEQLIYGKS